MQQLCFEEYQRGRASITLEEVTLAKNLWTALIINGVIAFSDEKPALNTVVIDIETIWETTWLDVDN